jgi:hypothetical protein
MTTFSTHDPYDAEWEHRDTGRTASFARDDDNFCEAHDCDFDSDDCTCE